MAAEICGTQSSSSEDGHNKGLNLMSQNHEGLLLEDRGEDRMEDENSIDGSSGGSSCGSGQYPIHKLQIEMNCGDDDGESENVEDFSESERERKHPFGIHRRPSSDLRENQHQIPNRAYGDGGNNGPASLAKFGFGSGKNLLSSTGNSLVGTGRSGSGECEMISPSPPGAPSTPGHNNNNNGSSSLNMIKGTGIVNGHGQHPGNFHGSSHRQQQRQFHQGFIGRSHHHHHHHHNRHSEPLIKSERKSQPNSPCDAVKPENPVNIGNALLNLASLGGLAALQQSLPNLMSSAGSPLPPNSVPSSSAGVLNAPLNLTNSSSFAHSQSLAQYISQNNSLFNSNNVGPTGGSGTMPQLILASGQIVQGIQGAQLVIPTSQGIMTQTILTIPLTQPGSPQSLFNGSTQTSVKGASNLLSSLNGNSAGANPCSPPVAPTVPPSNQSPDFPGPVGGLPAPLLNLAPHLVSQHMGAHIPMIHEKLGHPMEKTISSCLNGVRGMNGRRESHSGNSHHTTSHHNPSHGSINSNGGLSISAMCPRMSPCGSGSSLHDEDEDRFSDNDDSDQMVDGINLDEIKEFAKAFKLRRLSLGLTQTQVGQALSITEGPAYSQSAICSALAWQLAQSQSHSNRTSIPQQSMFEKLDITPKSAQKIKPVLERWMKEAEDRFKNGNQNLNEFVGMEPSKKRKRRTSFTPQALEILNTHFERNTHPSGAEITTLAHQLGYEREVIRIWFCNKRQALKNTVRMMSKASSPI